jgi:hypothetical protein
MDAANITLDIVRSYAQACADLHVAIEDRRAQGHDLLVVPSRGASPFIDGANSYAHALRNEKYQDFDLRAPRLWPIEELYLPFTADSADDFAISTATIRRFWSRVLAALVRRDRDDVALRFYQFLRARSGALATGAPLREGGKSGRFIFVDTVVSGRAICEIFDAFAHHGLDGCHYILLIDRAGEHLKSDYRRRIDEMAAFGRATKIYVDAIFTEDQGPAMSAIWSVTMPELMLRAQAMVPEFENAIGAGLYYHEVAKRADSSNVDITVSNAILGTLLYSAVRGQDDVAGRFLEDFKKRIGEGRLQDQAVTKSIADPLVLANLAGVVATDVSSSHVVRAELPRADAEALVKRFLRDLNDHR